MQINEAGGHLDQMMRQTRAHHVQLSTMADLKANMMLTAASLVLTFTIRYLADPALQWAALTLMVFCVLTIMAAVYSTMPRTHPQSRQGHEADTSSPLFNILFFGDFLQLEYDEYERQMEKVLNDPSETYERMTREIYGLGLFLAKKKYRFLAWSYRFFLMGFLAGGTVMSITQLLVQSGKDLWYLQF